MLKKLLIFVIFVSFAVYVLVLIYLVFLKNMGFSSNMSLVERLRNGYAINYIPFRTIETYLRALFNGSINIDIPIKNLVGNLLLFMPMGMYVPLFIKKFLELKVYACFMAMLITVIEIVQLLTDLGAFDVDDIILNLTGAFIGFVIFKYTPIWKLSKSITS